MSIMIMYVRVHVKSSCYKWVMFVMYMFCTCTFKVAAVVLRSQAILICGYKGMLRNATSLTAVDDPDFVMDL